jgi:hypothetical protein
LLLLPWLLDRLPEDLWNFEQLQEFVILNYLIDSFKHHSM